VTPVGPQQSAFADGSQQDSRSFGVQQARAVSSLFVASAGSVVSTLSMLSMLVLMTFSLVLEAVSPLLHEDVPGRPRTQIGSRS